MAYYIPPPKKVGGTRPPRPPPNCAHADVMLFISQAAVKFGKYWLVVKNFRSRG